MKNRLLIIFTIFVSAAMLYAEPVTPLVAKKVADRFADVYHSGSDLAPGEVVSYTLNNGEIAYHIVKLIPTGWVMVSGDDLLTPVIGYSFENQYVPMEQWGEAAKVWFDKVDRHIGEILEKPGLPVSDQWEEMFSSGYKKSTTDTVVEPFIPVNWDQGSGWNRFCPDDPEGPGDHAYVGCVSVCMAQAMSVYEYPVQPKGEHSYIHPDYGTQYVNFDKQSYAWDYMSATSPDDENAKLLYHLAVTVDMDFGADGSGSFTNRIPNALKKYFDYSESVRYMPRSTYSDSEWKQMLIDELLQGRPLIYSGDGNNDQAGHAFNIDGVGADGNYFHLNWGWSGTHNGYFTLDALNPGSNNFSFDHAAVIGIKPPSAGPYDIELSSRSVYEEQPEGTFVGKVSVADEFEDNVYSYELKGRYNIFLKDYGPADFYIENDSLKTAKVFDAGQYATEPLRIIVTDTMGNYYSEDFVITINKFYYGPTDITLSDTTVEEGRSPGYYVGTLEIEDDIVSNVYDFSFIGGYSDGQLTDDDCFYVRNDSLFTNMTFYKSEGLTYYVQVSITDKQNRLLKKKFQIAVTDNASGSTSEELQESVSGFEVYPNPAHAYITVDFDRTAGNQAFLQFYTVVGQKMFDIPVHTGQMIDISELRNGVYMVVITEGERRSHSKLVIYK
jgi:hypothetical protein